MNIINLAITLILTTVATIAARALAGGYAVMLLLGIVWGEFGLLKPLGFVSSMWLALAVAFVLFAYELNASFTVSQETSTKY